MSARSKARRSVRVGTAAAGRPTPVPVAVSRRRLPAIDWIKATAIVAVVITHALIPSEEDAPPDLDRWLHFLVQFCVPAFLVASGVLHAEGGGAALGRRLGRILGPYLVASAIAQVLGLTGAETATDVALQIVLGASLFIYYYVFLLVVCLLLTWLLERLHPRAPEVALAALAAWAIVTTIRPGPAEPFFWVIRNPLHFYGYYLAGLVAWRHRAVMVRATADRGALACGAICLLAIAAYVAIGPSFYYPSRTAGMLRALYTGSVVGLIALVGRRREAPAVVRFLSRTSYAIYLYHFFFEVLVEPPTLEWPGALRIAAVAGAGLVGATLVSVVGLRLLGTRARPLLGV